MKILIFLIFLAVPSYSQNFMLNMDVHEIKEDTTILSCNIRVIWGMREDKLCFLWGENHPTCFDRMKHNNIKSRKTRKIVGEYRKRLEKEEKVKNIKLRDLFYNKWEEVFLITIYMDEGILILINRIDDKYPHYAFTMTN